MPVGASSSSGIRHVVTLAAASDTAMSARGWSMVFWM